MPEMWRRHPKHASLEISSAGGVRRDGKTVAPFSNDKGYAWVNVGGRTFGVGVLVLETFVCARPEGCDCDHINSKRDDNRLENLRWLPRWLNRAKYGAANLSTKLSPDEVAEIRNRHRAGAAGRALAREYGVAESNIRFILSGATWRQAEFENCSTAVDYDNDCAPD